VTIPLDAPGGHPDEAAVYVGDPDRLGADAVGRKRVSAARGTTATGTTATGTTATGTTAIVTRETTAIPGSLSGSTSTSNRKRFGCG